MNSSTPPVKAHVHPQSTCGNCGAGLPSYQGKSISYLRVQVLNIHILAQTLYYTYYCPKPKYLFVGYLDPLGLDGGTRRGIGNVKRDRAH